jgi:hypothetical protein
MSEITIDIAPQCLIEALPLLPNSIKIIGSRLANGYVRLVAQVRNMPSGHYSVRVTDSVSRRIIDIWPEHDIEQGDAELDDAA